MDKVIRTAVLMASLVLALYGQANLLGEREHHPEDRKACAHVAR